MNCNNQEATPLEYLKQLKLSAKEVAGHYLSDPSTYGAAMRILKCADRLKIYSDDAYGTFIETWFCKHRSCPICQWRKSLRACSRMHSLLDDKPDLLNGKWIYLTLTVRNCLVEDLRPTIKCMNRAFQRLTNREFWKQHVYGGIRFTEVGDGGLDIHSAHPHFHCLLLVSPSLYKGNNYVSQKRWAEEWQQALQVHYEPIVHTRRLKGVGGNLRNQLISCTRYSMKPRLAGTVENSVKLPPKPSRGWFITMAQQMRDLRLVEPLGQVRTMFRELDDCQAVFEAMEEREEIRQCCDPPIHRWDDLSDNYEPEE